MLQADMCAFYRKAREDLLVAAENAGGWITTPYQCPENGPDGQPVFMDSFFSGSGFKDDRSYSGKKALVVIGGTHGMEGAAGSLVLKKIIEGGLRDLLPVDTPILLINALNPLGYAYGRRVNEDNIDLNRNAPESFPSGEKNSLVEAFLPSAWDEARIVELIKEGGEDLKDVVTKGQYQYPDGLFYGGLYTSWSIETLREICGLFLSRSKHVAVLDVHTGLGKYAEGEILSPVTDNKTADRLRSWFEPHGMDVRFVNSGESVASPVTGDVLSAISRWLPDVQVTPVALEFGTGVPVPESLLTLVGENALFHNPDAFSEEEAEKTSKDFVDVFFRKASDWQSPLWDHSQRILMSLIAGLGASE